MSDLVGNPEDRFSRVEAHMFHTVTIAAAITECIPEVKCK